MRFWGSEARKVDKLLKETEEGSRKIMRKMEEKPLEGCQLQKAAGCRVGSERELR